jgi:hypothetical protein
VRKSHPVWIARACQSSAPFNRAGWTRIVESFIPLIAPQLQLSDSECRRIARNPTETHRPCENFTRITNLNHCVRQSLRSLRSRLSYNPAIKQPVDAARRRFQLLCKKARAGYEGEHATDPQPTRDREARSRHNIRQHRPERGRGRPSWGGRGDPKPVVGWSPSFFTRGRLITLRADWKIVMRPRYRRRRLRGKPRQEIRTNIPTEAVQRIYCSLKGKRLLWLVQADGNARPTVLPVATLATV